MVPQEIDVALDELENRLDRLRSLYEQYFLGIEKIEPAVARKDVDRRFWILRRTQIRNTARRFRMQVLIQRYNTFQQYWARICREIENGTYTRHLLRVKKKFGEEPKTWAAKRRLGYFRRGAASSEEGVDPDAETLSGESSAPPSFNDASMDRSDAITLSGETASDFSRLKEDIQTLDLELDEPVAAPAPPVMARAAGQVSTTRFAGKPPPVSMPPLPPLSNAPRPPPLVRKADVPGKAPLPQIAPRAAGPQPAAREPAAAQGGAAPPGVAPNASVGPPRPKLPSVAGVAAPAAPRLTIPQAPTAPRPPAAQAPASRAPAPAVPVARPAAPVARPPAAPTATAPKAATAVPARPVPAASAAPAPGSTTVASAATPAAPRAPNATRAPQPPVPARAPAAQPAPPAARAPAAQPVQLAARAPLPATAPAAPAVARAPAARPSPAVAPAPAARPPTAQPSPPTRPAAAVAARPAPAVAPSPAVSAASAAMLSDDRVRQLHGELLATKQKLNQGNNVSLDALSKTLRETERKLREQHQGRSVDFHVVVKDGKPVVKPVVRK